jgi:hypothetical protein
LNGYGIASEWADLAQALGVQAGFAEIRIRSAAAARGLGKPLKLTCLMPPDSPFERIAIAETASWRQSGSTSRPKQSVTTTLRSVQEAATKRF